MFYFLKAYLLDNFMQTARPDANMRIMLDSTRQETTALQIGNRVRAGTGTLTGVASPAATGSRHIIQPTRTPAQVAVVANSAESAVAARAAHSATRGLGSRRSNHGPV